MSNNTQPEIRFPGFTEAWEQRKFKDFTKISQGLQIAISNRFLNEGENRLFYITNEFLNPSSSVKYYIENAPETVIANSDDILMTRTGNTGKVVTNVHGAFHNNFFKIAYDKSKTNKLFLFYLLNSNYIQNEIRIGAGSSTIPDLKHPNFYKINVNTTSLEEQTKIGNFFKSLDDTIALHQRKLDLLKETKKGFLQKMFPKNGAKVPEIRFPGFTEDWEERKLSEVANHRGGTAIEKYFKEDGKYKVISIGSYGLDSKYVDQNIRAVSNEVTDSRVVRNGELTMVLNDKTANGTIIGRSLLIEEDNKYVINQRNEIISPKENFDSNFAYTILNGPFRESVKRIVQGGTQIYVNYPAVSNLVLKLPDVEEQKKIGLFFKQLDDTIALHQRKLDLLKETKKGFLQKMFV
ncbi:restriction endonuclease subunit S [Enterococcus hirae]|uniref:restriction endonuclease subunit S n=1 Tax=Enterococcus hirae TaxID=1354 RepID=UPI002433D78C|nr:restriction endonuclease subunit S [Enterococcus hirae]